MIRDVPQLRGQRFFFQSFSMRSFRNFTRLFVSLSAAQMCKPQESCDQMEGRPGICKYQAREAPAVPAGAHQTKSRWTKSRFAWSMDGQVEINETYSDKSENRVYPQL